MPNPPPNRYRDFQFIYLLGFIDKNYKTSKVLAVLAMIANDNIPDPEPKEYRRLPDNIRDFLCFNGFVDRERRMPPEFKELLAHCLHRQKNGALGLFFDKDDYVVGLIDEFHDLDPEKQNVQTVLGSQNQKSAASAPLESHQRCTPS